MSETNLIAQRIKVDRVRCPAAIPRYQSRYLKRLFICAESQQCGLVVADLLYDQIPIAVILSDVVSLEQGSHFSSGRSEFVY